MAAGLHADFIDMAMANTLAQPRGLVVLGVPIELGAVTVDSYIVAGISDHITPWTNCYRTTQLFAGRSRFVLSTSGHIAALVNPPGKPRAAYYVNDHQDCDAQEWLINAQQQEGSWWIDAGLWLDDRCGALKPAPPRLGSNRVQPLADAPGTYVLDK
jgi:polyhydroxyalkanoate synthase subunit PhaC